MIRFWLKEYRDLSKNQGAMVILVGAVLIYSTFYPLPYSQETLRELPVGVVDLDFSELSRRLVRMVDANENIRITSRPVDLEEAKAQFYAGEIFGIFVIPEGFQRDIRRGVPTTVSGYYDTSALLFYRQFRTGLTYAVRTLSAGIQIKRFQAAGFSRDKAMASQDPAPVVITPLFNPSSGYGGYIVPAVFILLIHQTLLVGIGMVAGGRREDPALGQGRRPRIHEALQIVMGRTAAYFLISMLTALFNMSMIRFYYRYPLRAEYSEVIIFMLPFLISTILLGITISSLFRRRETAVLTLLFTSLPCLFLVGFAWPIESTPPWIRLISYVLPNTAGIDGFLKLTQMGARLKEIPFNYYELWALSGIYFVTALIAVKLADRIRQPA